VLPGGLAGSKEVLKFISEKLGTETYISLMSQYFPAYKATEDPDLSRRLTRCEYETAKRYLRQFHLDFGWTQEMN
jgi:putative pyruvate formate lyase activating enzyme